MAFRTQRLLDVASVLTIGPTLAAVASATLGGIESSWRLGSGISTLLFGSAWTVLLRSRRTLHGYGVAWVAAGGLGLLNVFLSAALTLPRLGESLFVPIAQTIELGALLWLPCLAAMFLSGKPVASTRAGLARRERRSAMAGAGCAMLCAAVVAFGPDRLAGVMLVGGNAPDPDAWLTRALAAVGAASGLATLAIASIGDLWRRRFVTAVGAGSVGGFRIGTTARGPVLLRTVSPGETYRLADVEQELALLDANGDTREVLATETIPPRRGTEP